ncbi:MAG: radical SAM protein [Chloroflexi bacterium]|nr:radical SAM protein [Chloroflexota bacterium]MCL5026422.1 radical SAM protein [Chloroflexota bacterium]
MSDRQVSGDQERVVAGASREAERRGRRPVLQPTDCGLAVTYRCNSRCQMCNIWRKPPTREHPPEAYYRLPESLRYVNLSGGEPFLRDDLVEIVRVVTERCHRPRIQISSNGLLPERIERQVRAILTETRADLNVGVSIDGIGDTHDQIRGVPGGFERAVETLRRVWAAGLRDGGINFTISDRNAHELQAVYSLAKEMGVEFSMTIVHNSEHYFDTQDNHFTARDMLRRQMDCVLSSELRSANPKRWYRAYYASGLLNYACGRSARYPCDAANGFFFLSPSLDVYPCVVLDGPMGNLGESTFDHIWSSKQAEAARRKVASCDERCWMGCTAFSVMRRNLPKVGAWAISRKLLAHLGHRVV